MEVVLYEIDPRIKEYVDQFGASDLRSAVSIHDKLESYATKENITNLMKDHFANDETLTEKEKDKLVKQTNEYCTNIISDEVKRIISEIKIRPDGRAFDEIRSLN